MSGKGDPIVCAFFLIILGVGFFLEGLRRLREKQAVDNTPTSKIHSLALGFAEVCGKASGSTSFPSPFTQTPCVWCRWLVQYWQSGKHSGWKTLKYGSLEPRFFVEDETGKVAVDPKGSTIDLSNDKQIIYGEDTPQHVIDFNKTLGVKDKTSSLFGGAKQRRLRYSEWFITPGETVYVLGTAKEIPGKMSANPEENLVLAKGTGFDPKIFIISDRTEKELIKQRYSKVWLYIFGAIVLTGIGILIGLLRVGWF